MAGVRRVRNPVDLARLVRDRSGHVFLLGEGAEAFAREQGVALVDPEYFITKHRREELRHVIEEEAAAGAPDDWSRLGTVGAVARDRDGNLAAATATGWGEYFIRNAVAHDLCARMKYRGDSVEQAAQTVIDGVTEAGGFGGVIALDGAGKLAMPYSTPRMVRGYVIAGQATVVHLDDE